MRPVGKRSIRDVERLRGCPGFAPWGHATRADSTMPRALQPAKRASGVPAQPSRPATLHRWLTAVNTRRRGPASICRATPHNEYAIPSYPRPGFGASIAVDRANATVEATRQPMAPLVLTRHSAQYLSVIKSSVFHNASRSSRDRPPPPTMHDHDSFRLRSLIHLRQQRLIRGPDASCDKPTLIPPKAIGRRITFFSSVSRCRQWGMDLSINSFHHLIVYPYHKMRDIKHPLPPPRARERCWSSASDGVEILLLLEAKGTKGSGRRLQARRKESASGSTAHGGLLPSISFSGTISIRSRKLRYDNVLAAITPRARWARFSSKGTRIRDQFFSIRSGLSPVFMLFSAAFSRGPWGWMLTVHAAPHVGLSTRRL